MANTWFKKKDANLVSYSKEPIPANDPPYNGNRYSQIDYILTKSKWRNNVIDVSNQIDANLDAFIDHFPIIAKIECRFKKKKPESEEQIKYKGKQSHSTIDKLNSVLKREFENKLIPT